MMSSSQISDRRGIRLNLYFQKGHNKSYSNIQFLLNLDKYFESYGKISEILPLLAWALSKYGNIT